MRSLFPAVCLAAASIFSLSSQAQKYTLKEAEEVMEDYYHADFYFPQTGQTVMINYAGRHGAFTPRRDYDNSTVTLFDNNMKKKYSKQLTEMAKMVYCGAFKQGNYLIILYTAQNGAVYKCLLNPETGTTNGTQLLFNGDNTNKYFGMAIYNGISQDSSHYFIVSEYKTKESDFLTYTGVILDNSLNISSKFSFTGNDNPYKTYKRKCFVTNEGSFILVNTTKVKWESVTYGPIQYRVTQANGASSINTILPLPDGHIGNVDWKLEGNSLSFVGVLSKSKKQDFTELLTGNFDLAQKKLVGVKEQSILEVPSVKNNTEKFMKDVVKKGIPRDTYLNKAITTNDGSSYIIIEQALTLETLDYARYVPANGINGSNGNNDTYADNVYIIKLSPGKDIVWISVLEKEQMQTMLPTYIFVYALPDTQNNLHLFYNDATSNATLPPGHNIYSMSIGTSLKRTSLTAAKITPDGKITKTLVQNNEDVELFFNPYGSQTVAPNKILYTAYHMKVAGNAQFRLGTLDLRF